MSLPSDARYQSTPSPELPAPGRNSFESLEYLKRPERDSIWWTMGQLLFLGLILVTPVLTLLVMIILKRDYVSMLWTHPLGMKMTVSTMALAFIGVLLYLGLCLPINRLFPAENPDRRTGRIAVSLLVNAALVILFFSPAFFALLVGPAAIQIQENMLNAP